MRVGVQSAIAHPEAGALLRKLMKPVKLSGVVTRWTGATAHASVSRRQGRQRQGRQLDARGVSAERLARTGWKKDVTVKAGDTISVFGWRARDGSPMAHLREATLADGKRLFFGPPAGTGEGGSVAGR